VREVVAQLQHQWMQAAARNEERSSRDRASVQIKQLTEELQGAARQAMAMETRNEVLQQELEGLRQAVNARDREIQQMRQQIADLTAELQRIRKPN
jgi:chromosome segregation ATPase